MKARLTSSIANLIRSYKTKWCWSCERDVCKFYASYAAREKSSGLSTCVEQYIFSFWWITFMMNNYHDRTECCQVILNNALDNEKGTTDIQSALMYFDSISKYMQQLRTALEELRDDIEWGLSWEKQDTGCFFSVTPLNALLVSDCKKKF